MPAKKEEITTIITPEVFNELRKNQVVDTESLVPIASEIVKKAQMELPLNAARTLRVLYTLIKPNDPPGMTYRFSLADYAKTFGIKTKKIYTTMTEACASLRGNITLPIGKNRVTGLISTAQVSDNEVEIVIDPVLLEYYKKDKEQYSYRLKSIQGLAYAITFKFYELCMLHLGNDNEAYFEMELDVLKDYLQTRGEYNEYRDFKRRVLATIISDINGEKPNAKSRISENNMCNIHVSFTEKKEKRKVVAIAFEVKRIIERETVEVQPIDFFSTLTTEEQDAYNWLRTELKIAPSAIKNCINYYIENPSAEGSFLKIYEYIVYSVTTPEISQKIKNKTTWSAKCLRDRLFNEVPKAVVADEAAAANNPDAEAIMELLVKYGITSKDRQTDIISHKPDMICAGRVKSNIDYVIKKYPDSEDIVPLIYKSIMEDYAGYDKKQAALEEERRYLARQKEIEAMFTNMSDEELENYSGENQEEAAAVLSRRKEERMVQMEAMIDMAFDEFLESDDGLEFERIKLRTLATMPKFSLDMTKKKIAELGISKPLEDIDTRELLKISPFKSAFRIFWRNEYIAKNKLI